ncbi:MAG: hypothetical protein EON60_02160 [Alphaproteobacteria bacterium]|nr:MAG: hypothetical protein EON60_02160 [Alphaproteobacteria bacterium]
MSRGYSSDFRAYEPTHGQPTDLFGGFAQSGAPPHRTAHRQLSEVSDDGEYVMRELPEDSNGRTWDERDDE